MSKVLDKRTHFSKYWHELTYDFLTVGDEASVGLSCSSVTPPPFPDPPALFSLFFFLVNFDVFGYNVLFNSSRYLRYRFSIPHGTLRHKNQLGRVILFHYAPLWKERKHQIKIKIHLHPFRKKNDNIR